MGISSFGYSFDIMILTLDMCRESKTHYFQRKKITKNHKFWSKIAKNLKICKKGLKKDRPQGTAIIAPINYENIDLEASFRKNNSLEACGFEKLWHFENFRFPRKIFFFNFFTESIFYSFFSHYWVRVRDYEVTYS